MKTLKSIAYYLRNKAVSFGFLALAILIYNAVPSGTPFVEMAYAAIVVLCIINIAPVLRLLVFNEAAVYAEAGGLDADLKLRELTPALLHYWFATAICYLSPIIVLALAPK